MTLELLQAGTCGIHYYTFNLERSTRLVLEGAGLVSKMDYIKKNMPWRPSFDQKRKEESVRPIFWSNRAKSYISRTDNWDEFPNGRWGDSRSPAYGDLDRYGVYLKYTADEAIQHWGTPNQIEDIYELFVKYCHGENLTLPWSDQALALESGTIKDHLMELNSIGYLTINSQPAVNGAKSDDKIFGWGPKGGYVYQKVSLSSGERIDRGSHSIFIDHLVQLRLGLFGVLCITRSIGGTQAAYEQVPELYIHGDQQGW